MNPDSPQPPSERYAESERRRTDDLNEAFDIANKDYSDRLPSTQRSSAIDEVVASDEEPPFSVSRPFNDKLFSSILSDLEPDSPLKLPSEPVEQHASKFSEQETRAQHERAQRLRDNPAVRTALTIVRGNPDIWDEVSSVIARQDELIADTFEEGERHRAFTGLLTGIALSERGGKILDTAIERTTEAETAWFREQLSQGNNYVHELVIGAGPHAAIYNAERQHQDPDHPALTVDHNKRIGGQFAQAERATWHLNSRTRPDDPTKPHLPGTPGSLNTLMRGVVMQGDLETQAYGTQDRLATAVRIDHLMASKIMAGCDLVGARKNPDWLEAKPGTGRYIVEVKDATTGDALEIKTDRIITTTGLGESKTGLEQAGRRTQDILRQEQAKFDRGEMPQVMTFEQFAQRMGDSTNPFPLQGFTRVAVVGPGDSGKVAIEYLHGYGPEAGKSVKNLDNVEKVTWIGQGAMSKEDFEECERQRYQSLGLEMPRQDKLDYYSRIQPLDERATALKRREDGQIEVATALSDYIQDGQVAFPSGITNTPVDLVILTAGYEDMTDKIFSDLTAETITDPDEIKLRVSEILETAGASITYDNGQKFEITNIVSLGRGARDIDFKLTLPSGSVIGDTFRLVRGESTDARYVDILNLGKAIALDMPSTPGVVDTVLSERDGNPIAVQYRGTEVYKTGPAAQLPLTTAERRQTVALRNIPENTAAIFRTAPSTSQLAVQLSRQDHVSGVLPDMLSVRPTRERKILPKVKDKDYYANDGKYAGDIKSIFVDVPDSTNLPRLPVGANTRDLANYAVVERSAIYKFPDDLGGIYFDFARVSSIDGDQLSFRVSGLSIDLPEYRAYVDELLKDPIILRVMERATARKSSVSQTGNFGIYFENGRIRADGVEISPEKITKEY